MEATGASALIILSSKPAFSQSYRSTTEAGIEAFWIRFPFNASAGVSTRCAFYQRLR